MSAEKQLQYGIVCIWVLIVVFLLVAVATVNVAIAAKTGSVSVDLKTMFSIVRWIVGGFFTAHVAVMAWVFRIIWMQHRSITVLQSQPEYTQKRSCDIIVKHFAESLEHGENRFEKLEGLIDDRNREILEAIEKVNSN